METGCRPGEPRTRKVEYDGGVCVPIIGRTSYTLEGPASSVQEWVYEKYIDTLSWRTGVVVVRYYSKGTFTTGVTVEVVVQNVSFAEDEPQTVFADTANETAVTIDSSTTAPTLLTAALETPIARHVRVLLRVTEPGSSPGPATFAIGVDLIGRDA